MNAYVRCVFANKFTLLGYIGFAVFIVQAVFSFNEYLPVSRSDSLVFTAYSIAVVSMSIGGLVLLLGTGCGLHTYVAYRRALTLLRGGKMILRVRDSYENGLYCEYTGYKVAEREYHRRLQC